MKTEFAMLLIGIFPALQGVEFVMSDFGGSPVPVGAGPRALGMGGAFTAIADDATANTWNPAGMTQLKEREFSAGLAVIAINGTAKRRE